MCRGRCRLEGVDPASRTDDARSGVQRHGKTRGAAERSLRPRPFGDRAHNEGDTEITGETRKPAVLAEVVPVLVGERDRSARITTLQRYRYRLDRQNLPSSAASSARADAGDH